jgi:hypothetical protein
VGGGFGPAGEKSGGGLAGDPPQPQRHFSPAWIAERFPLAPPHHFRPAPTIPSYPTLSHSPACTREIPLRTQPCGASLKIPATTISGSRRSPANGKRARAHKSIPKKSAHTNLPNTESGYIDVSGHEIVKRYNNDRTGKQ